MFLFSLSSPMLYMEDSESTFRHLVTESSQIFIDKIQ